MQHEESLNNMKYNRLVYSKQLDRIYRSLLIFLIKKSNQNDCSFDMYSMS